MSALGRKRIFSEPAIAAVFDLAKTHQFLAANDKTNLIPRCFKPTRLACLFQIHGGRREEGRLAITKVRGARWFSLSV